MRRGVKIVTIGGGSSYTPELVDGFLKRYESLPVRELWLVDVPQGKEKMEICSRACQKNGSKGRGSDGDSYNFESQRGSERCKICNYTAKEEGELQARIKDERIPLSHGILGTGNQWCRWIV